ncbi:phosphoribosylanthranilate isomerase [Bacillus taeanensis]|uniref:N-(5'-phosphoribosyl)anthranilate isomerase n=1 Tax=Bacillus taeanensis TaxID=273032 RepID=A0A366XXV7_9BACI|nr:phosphoribosylanthranilate isomerase [Bacillus taeanensis]RBW70398.1 phosphoribosylanthranilate isomerase [Bacillus taeanensis]
MQLKYCGNHSLSDLEIVAASRTNYIGFVFAESKRKADPKEIREWLEKVEFDGEKKIVGVFVNPTIEEISTVMKEVPLDVIQCHGEEPPTMVVTLKNIFSVEIWKVIHHHKHALEQMEEYAGLVDAFLIDKRTKTARGGTGETFDWTFVPKYLEKARSLEIPCFIAGGVNPDNVSELLTYQPDGIDLASGIEIDGQKHTKKIQQLEERMSKDVYKCS